jgi:hypothetical protein
MFPFSDIGDGGEGRCNFISNGADRKDIVTLFKEMITRFEGQPEMKRGSVMAQRLVRCPYCEVEIDDQWKPIPPDKHSVCDDCGELAIVQADSTPRKMTDAERDAVESDPALRTSGARPAGINR